MQNNLSINWNGLWSWVLGSPENAMLICFFLGIICGILLVLLRIVPVNR